MFRREDYIEGQDELMLSSIATTKNVDELEKIKKEHGLKIYLKLTPLFDYINNNKLAIEDNNKLIDSIMNNIYIYYYMNNDVLILILNYTLGQIGKLQTLLDLVINNKTPKKVMIENNQYEGLSATYKKIYNIRYNNMLIRYVNHLIQLFK